MKYWITIDKSTLGPLTAEEIKAQFLDKISASTPCAKLESNEWSTAGALFPELNLVPSKPLAEDILPEKKDPSPKHDSVFHKLANTAIYALISVFLLDVFFAGFTRDALRNGIQWPFYIKTIFGMLLIASSFICGFISLFGIRKYGKRKLLWKGLVCTMLPVLVMAGAVMLKNNKPNKTEPNQAPEPTTMAVTAAASHLPRQPRSRLIFDVSQIYERTH